MKKQLTIETVSADEMIEMLVRRLSEIINNKEKEDYQWYNRKQTAEMLDVSTKTLHNWSRAGILVPRSIGNRIYYRSDEVELAMKPINSSDNRGKINT